MTESSATPSTSATSAAAATTTSSDAAAAAGRGGRGGGRSSRGRQQSRGRGGRGHRNSASDAASEGGDGKKNGQLPTTNGDGAKVRRSEGAGDNGNKDTATRAENTSKEDSRGGGGGARRSGGRGRGRGGRGRGRAGGRGRREDTAAGLEQHEVQEDVLKDDTKDDEPHDFDRFEAQAEEFIATLSGDEAETEVAASSFAPFSEPDVLTSLLTGVPPTLMPSTATDVQAVEPESISAERVLSLPSARAIKLGGKKGVPMILSRHNAPPAVDGDDGAEDKSEKPTKKKPRKKKKPIIPEEEIEELPAIEQVSTSQALEKLPGRAVSISAGTQVVMRRNESQTSLGSDNKNNPADNTNNAFTNSAAAETSKKGAKITAAKKKKGKGGGHLATGDAVNQQLARRFNQQIRMAVDQSDLVGMRELLHDKRNHHFALDANVLETVQKAFMTAALFDDGLYCLRSCTVPGTMALAQTERILMCLPQNLRNSSSYTAADLMNALCIATEFDSPKKRTYFLRICRGIALEFLEEATSARDRICSAPCDRLVRAGLCIVDARLKRGKKPADLVVVPGNQLCFVPENLEQRGIAPGDAVSILPYAGPYPMSSESLDRNMIEATVTNINPVVLRLQDKLNTNLYASLTEALEGNVYRIDKLANRMGFNRQLNAAVAICSPIDSNMRDFRRPCPQLIEAVTSMDESIFRFNGALPRGELTSTAALCSEAIAWNVADEGPTFDSTAARDSNRLVLEKYGLLEGLNPSQTLALEGATINRLSLVQGPPGTGKTAVAIRIIQHWARLREAAVKNGDSPAPILATSDSNIAVDNLVEGCAAVGLRVVRLGRPEAVRPELLRYCIDRPPSQYGSNQDRSGGGYQTQMTGYKERMKQMKDAQIVCCTCIGSGSDILDMFGPLEHILVDEATQATEPAILVPITRGCRQLVLVGDHCQLPPTVLSTRAEEEGHGVPLFSRMVACGVPPFMLDTQYRMHPGIAQFPSDLFYGGLLKNGVSAPERRPLPGFSWPREEFPVAYVPVYGVEMDDGVSKYNEAEAAAACDAVAALMAGGHCAVGDIAVVTPYAAQARLIRRLIRQLIQTTGPPFVEVSSVDGFQGREKEAIVFSAVRSNDYGAIGFTSDWRRVNVSFTRARRALIVIGNDQTLRRGDPDTWMPWLAWADAQGVNMSNPGMPRGRYEPEQLRRVRGGTTAAEMLKHVLERQQAQVKSAEQDQQRAEKNARGHIVGGATVIGADTDDSGRKVLSLEEDLAQMANTEGNWDDSDDDDAALVHCTSKVTLASTASSNDVRSGDSADAVDIWDL